MKVVVGLIVIPLFPIAVFLNTFGIADKLSGLPGITKGGGLISGFSAMMMVALLLGIAVGGALVVSGADKPVIGNGDEPESTTTPTPTVIPTAMSTETMTPTPAPTPKPQHSDLEAFKTDYRDRIQRSMQADDLTGVPILALEYREADNGTNELWAIYWECDNLDYTRDQRFTIANYFANNAANFDGDEPDRLRAYGVTNLESYSDSITFIPTSSAEAAYNRSLDRGTYTENWSDRMREPTDSESDIAFQMTVNESGESKAEKAFNEHYPLEESDRGCPGGAEGVDDD